MHRIYFRRLKKRQDRDVPARLSCFQRFSNLKDGGFGEIASLKSVLLGRIVARRVRFGRDGGRQQEN